MTDSTQVPTCPYCGSAWTAAMLHVFDRHSRGIACSCCVVMPGLGLEQSEAALPQQDLCCDHCGKPIYSAPKSAAGAESPAPAAGKYRNAPP